MTDKEYLEDLVLIKRNAPNHPLLPLLIEGATAINKIRMPTAISYMQQNPEDLPKKEEVAVKVNIADGTLSSLIGKRAKLANEMHGSCEKRGLNKRKRLNDEILDINSQIQVFLGYKEKTPDMPKPFIEVDYQGKSKAELLIMRGRISAARTRQRTLIANNTNDKRGEKLKAKLIQIEKSYEQIQIAIQAAI